MSKIHNWIKILAISWQILTLYFSWKVLSKLYSKRQKCHKLGPLESIQEVNKLKFNKTKYYCCYIDPNNSQNIGRPFRRTNWTKTYFDPYLQGKNTIKQHQKFKYLPQAVTAVSMNHYIEPEGGFSVVSLVFCAARGLLHNEISTPVSAQTCHIFRLSKSTFQAKKSSFTT